MSRIAKLLAALSTVATLTGTALANGDVDGTEARAIALGLVGALVVYLSPRNTP